MRDEQIFAKLVESPEFKQEIKDLSQAYHEDLNKISVEAKPLIENTELYKYLTQEIASEQGNRRLVAKLGKFKLDHARELNEDSKFLIDFTIRQLLTLE